MGPEWMECLEISKMDGFFLICLLRVKYEDLAAFNETYSIYICINGKACILVSHSLSLFVFFLGKKVDISWETVRGGGGKNRN